MVPFPTPDGPLIITSNPRSLSFRITPPFAYILHIIIRYHITKAKNSKIIFSSIFLCYNIFGDFMSIDGRFIYHLSKELNQDLQGLRIQRISQLSKADFLFSFNNNKNLYISLSTAMARVHLSKESYVSSIKPGGFCMFLRKHIEKGVVKEIITLNDDRIIRIMINNRNEIGDFTDYYLIIEIFGRYANMIILNNDSLIINAFKHIHPFDNPDRIIVNNVEYTLPPDLKISPTNLVEINSLLTNNEITYKLLVDNIRGLSPLISKYLVKEANYNPSKTFELYQDFINRPIKPTMSENKFYYLDIFDDEDKLHFDSISELLTQKFSKEASLDRVRQIHKYLSGVIKNNLEKFVNKLEKLSKDLINAKNYQIYRIKGDLLLSNQHQITPYQANITLYSYETGQDIEIELDRLLTTIENANNYYTKYKKQKNAIIYIEEQISITQRNINYFSELSLQIEDNFILKDLEEIQEELTINHFIHRQLVKNKRKEPNYDVYHDQEGVKILVGKNNLQNNYLTHKIAKKNYTWFHVKDQTGSHVIVCSEEQLTELTIRAAANLAALNSKSKNSSSVPVDYTKVKFIKKIPGEIGSFVSYTNQKTIYIDPNKNLINNLRKG